MWTFLAFGFSMTCWSDFGLGSKLFRRAAEPVREGVLAFHLFICNAAPNEARHGKPSLHCLQCPLSPPLRDSGPKSPTVWQTKPISVPLLLPTWFPLLMKVFTLSAHLLLTLLSKRPYPSTSLVP